jgi:hypothetical protein
LNAAKKVTSFMNGHQHEFMPGDDWTSVEEGHRHPIKKGREIGTRKKIWVIVTAEGHIHHVKSEGS